MVPAEKLQFRPFVSNLKNQLQIHNPNGTRQTQLLIHNSITLYHSLKHKTVKRKFIKIQQYHKEFICLQSIWVCPQFIDCPDNVNVCSALALFSKMPIMQAITVIEMILPWILHLITMRKMFWWVCGRRLCRLVQWMSRVIFVRWTLVLTKVRKCNFSSRKYAYIILNP